MRARWRLAALLWLLGLRPREIASRLGYTYGSIRHVLCRPQVRAEVEGLLLEALRRAREAPLPPALREGPGVSRSCPTCSRPIPPWCRKDARYCSRPCARKARRRARKGL